MATRPRPRATACIRRTGSTSRNTDFARRTDNPLSPRHSICLVALVRPRWPFRHQRQLLQRSGLIPWRRTFPYSLPVAQALGDEREPYRMSRPSQAAIDSLGSSTERRERTPERVDVKVPLSGRRPYLQASRRQSSPRQVTVRSSGWHLLGLTVGASILVACRQLVGGSQAPGLGFVTCLGSGSPEQPLYRRPVLLRPQPAGDQEHFTDGLKS